VTPEEERLRDAAIELLEAAAAMGEPGQAVRMMAAVLARVLASYEPAENGYLAAAVLGAWLPGEARRLREGGEG
jgi:hypothetical protein